MHTWLYYIVCSSNLTDVYQVMSVQLLDFVIFIKRIKNLHVSCEQKYFSVDPF